MMVMRRKKRRVVLLYIIIIFALLWTHIFLLSHLNNTIIDDGRYHHQKIQRSTPDAYFNTYPIYLRESTDYFHSTVHCVGETHESSSAWKHRSCDYTTMCLDFSSFFNQTLKSKEVAVPEFFIVASASEKEFRERFYHPSSSSSSSTESAKELYYSSTDVRDVALGGINPRWKGSTRILRHGFEKVKWKPKVYSKFPYSHYFELEKDVVMIPFHSFAADNVGHLLWDDLLPIYNLLKIFGYERNKYDDDNINNEFRHLLIRVDTLPQLYATCDLRQKKKDACKENFDRFLPLFGVNTDTFSTLTEIRLTKTNSKSDLKKSNFPKQSPSSFLSKYPVVCSKHAVAGIGLLTDHGIRDHGWMTNNEQHPIDVAIARNVGRGPELYAFRNFLLRNIGAQPKSLSITTTTPSTIIRQQEQQQIRFRIILSAFSSNHPDRNFGFEKQQTALTASFPTTDVITVVFSNFSLWEQVELIASEKQNKSSMEHIIFITACGGGAITGFFLPKDSSMIVYYPETGGYDFSSKFNYTGGQAMLDWDLLNNLSYLRTHWLPIGKMNHPEGLDALVYLVRHEMDVTINKLLS